METPATRALLDDVMARRHLRLVEPAEDDSDDDPDWDADPAVLREQDATWHAYRRQLADEGRCIHGVYTRQLGMDFNRPLGTVVHPVSEWVCAYCGVPESACESASPSGDDDGVDLA